MAQAAPATSPTAAPHPSGGTGFDQFLSQITTLAPKLQTPAQKKAVAGMEQSAERSAKLMDALKKRLAEPLPSLPAETAIPKAPNPPAPDPMQAFGQPAVVLALFGSLMTRQPLTTALNSAAAAMNASRRGQLQEAELAREKWKDSLNQALLQSRNELSRYKAVLDQHNKSVNDILSELKGEAAQFKNYNMLAAVDSGNLDAAAKLVSTYQTQQLRLATLLEQDEARKWSQPAEVMADDGKGGQKQVLAQQNKITGEWVTADENRTPLKVSKKLSTSEQSVISDDAAKLVAEGVLAGNHQAMTGMARSQANITKVNDWIAKLAKERGMSGADIAAKQAEFSGELASERALGTRTANMEIAANEVKNMAPLALSLSDKVDRSQYPTLNSAILAAERGTGGEDVVRFGLATNSLIYMYAKFLNPNGIPTDADKARATDILSTAWAKGQFKAAVHQIEKEIEVGQAGLKTTRGEVNSKISGKKPEGEAPHKSSAADYATADDVLRAVDERKLDPEKAKQILIDKFGYKPKGP